MPTPCPKPSLRALTLGLLAVLRLHRRRARRAAGCRSAVPSNCRRGGHGHWAIARRQSARRHGIRRRHPSNNANFSKNGGGWICRSALSVKQFGGWNSGIFNMICTILHMFRKLLELSSVLLSWESACIVLVFNCSEVLQCNSEGQEISEAASRSFCMWCCCTYIEAFYEASTQEIMEQIDHDVKHTHPGMHLCGYSAFAKSNLASCRRNFILEVLEAHFFGEPENDKEAHFYCLF